MADDHVLDQDLQLAGKAGQMRELLVQHFQFDDHVSQQLALGGVRNRALIREFVQLSNVVQEGAAQQQVAVHLGIVAGGKVANGKQRDHVVEQPADKRVVQRLGRGRVLVRGDDRLVGHEFLEQRFQPAILEALDEFAQRAP